ncbi:cytidylate kinase [Solidesulfovibrio fructosivorans JJ]]|uniref:Cytidylate kinase n=1 Tax=Solidesulfovibrio fructosivorans JJ] TaxID=596151 RepID=E1JVQ7_SOLFR|nr:(d)CMP kinase [Solidesulfovibrio fructosivorans]EFL51545.1 cytidylate kinase [Solidesulfovibrio fructosivorans JJ]]
MAAESRRIVTIDGPAGAGKTTVSRRAAGELGVAYLDTGAMFRALALALGEGGHRLPEATIDARLAAMTFALEGSGADTLLLVDGAPLPDAARTERVGGWASNLAVLPVVRRRLRLAQQALGASTDLLAEGRDMGTVVFPEARHKFFLTASPEVRAGRRVLQLESLGKPADYEAILEAIRHRDAQDQNRAEAPLVAAKDALVIDTSDLTEDAVVARIVAAAAV